VRIYSNRDMYAKAHMTLCIYIYIHMLILISGLKIYFVYIFKFVQLSFTYVKFVLIKFSNLL